ncbi:uncharacterized protein LOC124266737 [Haliotis rubra]|uniref:uncharacterized protein LOC124266737 n=1 Tax=Haliotis rubra TaxID=36100 RepID=UPI001EE54763|nr:uncharacterized protein LOC124266737 [Haliotis rubra]
MSTLPITLSCLLLLAAASSAKPALDRAKKTSDPNQWKLPCFLGGRVHFHGAVFLAENRCSRLQCIYGRIYFVDIKCFHNNTCYNAGDNIRAGQNGCQLLKCQRNGELRPVQSDRSRCRDAGIKWSLPLDS